MIENLEKIYQLEHIIHVYMYMLSEDSGSISINLIDWLNFSTVNCKTEKKT